MRGIAAILEDARKDPPLTDHQAWQIYQTLVRHALDPVDAQALVDVVARRRVPGRVLSE